MASSARPVHLEPSQLGTKEYWDALYSTELRNHAADPSDIGTVWFDDSDAEAKMVSYLALFADEGDESGLDGEEAVDEDGRILLRFDRDAASFLDLGCGNGSLLLALREDEWRGRMLGVDYSELSVRLARRISKRRREQEEGDEEEAERGGEGGDEQVLRTKGAEGTASGRLEANSDAARGPAPDGGEELEPNGQAADLEEGHLEAQEDQDDSLSFRQWDILAGSLSTILNGAQSSGWDIVLDKGTFDAISLSAQQDPTGRRISEGYAARVLRLVRNGGIFLITSCNWTEEELKAWFEGQRATEPALPGAEQGDGNEEPSAKFVQIGRVSYRSFSFGGVKGQTISTVCFQKKVPTKKTS